MKIVSENRFSRKTYFYTIASRLRVTTDRLSVFLVGFLIGAFLAVLAHYSRSRAAAARDQLYKIGLPGKSILGDYFQENRTSRRPYLSLRISFPGRFIFIQLPPGPPPSPTGPSGPTTLPTSCGWPPGAWRAPPSTRMSAGTTRVGIRFLTNRIYTVFRVR